MAIETATVRIEKMVEGGKGMGRDKRQRAIFVLGALPTEKVRVRIDYANKRFAEATLIDVITPARARSAPKCNHAGQHNECGFQHIAYPTQLKFKESILHEQMLRIATLDKPNIRPILGNPKPWEYRIETTFSLTPDNQLGYWSPIEQKVLPVDDCHTLHRTLRAALRSIDLELDNMRKLTLRVGADDEVQVVLNMNDAEPPELESDISVSVSIVLPDGIAATLIGDPYLVQQVKDRTFRVSAGSFFHPSIAGAEKLVETVLKYADLQGDEKVLECMNGVGMLTAFLAEGAAEVIGIDKNGDSIDDAAHNLDHTENVALYNAWIEDVLPELEMKPDIVVADLGIGGITGEAGVHLAALGAQKIIMSCWDVGISADVSAELSKAYHLVEMQPIDMQPQTHYVHTVALWRKR